MLDAHARDAAATADHVVRAAALHFRRHGAIAEIARDDWNALLDDCASPFMRWEWLEALERSGCVGPGSGWTPAPLALYRGARLVAAAPAYLHDDSDGDFAQDWSWADAAGRAGIALYPKLAVTVPFTPASGRRFLVAPDEDAAAAIRTLIEGAVESARDAGCGAVQALFCLDEESRLLAECGLARRVLYQYHWRNAPYASLDDFLRRFSSKKRNAINRERAAPERQGVAIRTVRGEELERDPDRWAAFADAIHQSTVEKLFWGRRWINRAFYRLVIERLPGAIEIVAAEREGRLVAGAFNLATPSRLYGRYWGCLEEHPFLHFNVCFYHSIEECIRLGRGVFEPGAGGEHKLARGFEPAETYSAHLFLDRRLDAAVRAAIARENAGLDHALADWRGRKPVLKR